MASENHKIVIIGAGPTGLLLAFQLWQRGRYAVEIYEKRPDPRRVDPAQSRTFPISLQERGRRALRAVPGLEANVIAQGVLCTGTYIYRAGKPPRHLPREIPLLTIDRNRLVMILLDHLSQMVPPEQVQIHFDCPCIAVNGDERTLTFEPKSGERFTVSYDRLVGADGAKSCVRQYLTDHSGIHCDQTLVPDAYRSLFFDLSNPALGVAMEPDKLHGQNINNQLRLVMVPQPGNQLNGVMIFDAEQDPFAEFKTVADLQSFFQERFPRFAQVMPESEAEALLHRPPSRVVTVKCDRFHAGDRILILGDAAHAVSPSIGQGCNSALEDVWLFNQLLDQYQDDWGQALPAFSQQRVPDAHALRELSDYSFPRSKGLMLEFFVRLQASRLLHKVFPQRFKPFLFDLIMDADTPYAEVLQLNHGWVKKVKRSMTQSTASSRA